jgi:hypothetical protein
VCSEAEPTIRADGAWFVRGSADGRPAARHVGTVAHAGDRDAQNVKRIGRRAVGWLWALALIATFNPLFVALALPRARRARSGRRSPPSAVRSDRS